MIFVRRDISALEKKVHNEPVRPPKNTRNLSLEALDSARVSAYIRRDETKIMARSVEPHLGPLGSIPDRRINNESQNRS